MKWVLFFFMLDPSTHEQGVYVLRVENQAACEAYAVEATIGAEKEGFESQTVCLPEDHVAFGEV